MRVNNGKRPCKSPLARDGVSLPEISPKQSTAAILIGILALSCFGIAVYRRKDSCTLRLNVQIRLPNGSAIVAEVSDSWPAIERGLMGRASLPAAAGMLFVYPKVGRHRHWMFGCTIPDALLLPRCGPGVKASSLRSSRARIRAALTPGPTPQQGGHRCARDIALREKQNDTRNRKTTRR